jgi:hypothetical protein
MECCKLLTCALSRWCRVKIKRICEPRVHWETFIPQHRKVIVSAACRKDNHSEYYVLTCKCSCGHPVAETQRVNRSRA